MPEHGSLPQNAGQMHGAVGGAAATPTFPYQPYASGRGSLALVKPRPAPLPIPSPAIRAGVSGRPDARWSVGGLRADIRRVFEEEFQQSEAALRYLADT